MWFQTWTPHGFQVDHAVSNVDTMWFPSGHHVVSEWTRCGFSMDAMWFPHGYHMVSTLILHGFQETTQKPAQKTALHEANWPPC